MTGGGLNSVFFHSSPLIRALQVVIGTGLFSGYFPFFPGTVGSVVGAVCLIILPQEWYYSVILLAFVLIIGTWAADGLARRWGKDPSRVVIDEIAGIIITLAPYPKDIHLYVSGFILFRFFDIVKPYPCRRLEKIHGGLGIMLDDIAAAIYACILLYVIFILFN